MLQNACKILGCKKNMVYKIPPGGGGKPYPASGLIHAVLSRNTIFVMLVVQLNLLYFECEHKYAYFRLIVYQEATFLHHLHFL